MTFKEIQLKTKYYKGGLVKEKRNCRHRETLCTIYVLAKDEINKRVYASINGLPAIWCDAQYYRKWKKENPLKKAIA
ncbi:hypothetical protein [Foetidibacter luteolus]|uniref:hypothetical protein n=1 Tax=Foetidibacter luteolus TaxID=2608880 RepID=UPI00129BBFC3|nr:hypothetical protein [Foetidibacter luteolus]